MHAVLAGITLYKFGMPLLFKTPVASCLSQRCFKQIQRAFIIQDSYTSPQQPGESWWFRVEPLATTIREACQKYWTPEAHLAVDECMVPYFGHT